MERIKIGFTNLSYKKENSFFQTKVINKFNHKIDYKILSKLEFVPKLLNDNQENIEWEWIETKDLVLDEQTLKTIADNFKKLHDSKLEFPKTNIAARVKEYRRILAERNIKIPVVDKYFKRINSILKNSENNRPCHNDLYIANVLQAKDGKVFFIDWEYATMGDKHFDLAYFICGAYLNEEQEKIFLDQYDSYWEEYLIQQKILVYYITILWCNSQDVKPFDDSPLYVALEKTVELYQYKKENKLFRN
ncbi:phosphotransferase [Mycoplasma corogypsi]|uniref:phosphotransferase n=1 Tax=Mycoplasma corogypsi TaxID=2106 RepID=UPI003872F3D7